jgi:hypothetical protein
VTYKPVGRQRVGKHIRAEEHARNSRTSIARPRVNEQAFSAIERLCFPCGPRRGVIKVCLSKWVSRIGLSSVDGSQRYLRRYGKKGIRV